ncbi:MAG: methylenetetrahydrofolate reductase [NAD(P)H] [Lachnospiraceae bacterium]
MNPNNTNRKPSFLSFEVFPPKTDEDFDSAYETLNALANLNPDFISVTYGAGGSKSKKTIEIASYIQNTLQIEAIAHFTCVGSTKADIMSVYHALQEANVSTVLALRGDRPANMSDEQYNAREFTYASDMITYLKEHTSLRIAGACYPEKHFEAVSKASDLANLQKKVAAGATFLITQLFLDNEFLYRFLDRAREIGITVPICAGIMPITSAKQLGTTVSLSGSSVPKELADLIATYGDNAVDMRKAGIDYAIRQILDLRAHGVNDIHLYTMNKAKMAAEIVAGI